MQRLLTRLETARFIASVTLVASRFVWLSASGDCTLPAIGRCLDRARNSGQFLSYLL